MYCTKFFSGILVLSLYGVLDPVRSEYCTAPEGARIIELPDDSSYFLLIRSGISNRNIFPSSLCGNLIFGLRHSCWTENEIQSAINTDESSQLPNKWSRWVKHHLVNSKLQPFNGILKVWPPPNQHCLYQWHVGPVQAFAKKARASDRIMYHHRSEQTMDHVSILGGNNGRQHNVKVNTSFHLTCQATGNPKPSTEWSLPYNVSLGDGVRVDGKVLHFDSIQPHHAGEYRCKGSQYTVRYDTELQRAYRHDHERSPQFSSVIILVQ